MEWTLYLEWHGISKEKNHGKSFGFPFYQASCWTCIQHTLSQLQAFEIFRISMKRTGIDFYSLYLSWVSIYALAPFQQPWISSFSTASEYIWATSWEQSRNPSKTRLFQVGQWVIDSFLVIWSERILTSALACLVFGVIEWCSTERLKCWSSEMTFQARFGWEQSQCCTCFFGNCKHKYDFSRALIATKMVSMAILYTVLPSYPYGFISAFSHEKENCILIAFHRFPHRKLQTTASRQSCTTQLSLPFPSTSSFKDFWKERYMGRFSIPHVVDFWFKRYTFP